MRGDVFAVCDGEVLFFAAAQGFALARHGVVGEVEDFFFEVAFEGEADGERFVCAGVDEAAFFKDVEDARAVCVCPSVCAGDGEEFVGVVVVEVFENVGFVLLVGKRGHGVSVGMGGLLACDDDSLFFIIF